MHFVVVYPFFRFWIVEYVLNRFAKCSRNLRFFGSRVQASIKPSVAKKQE